MGQPSGVVTGRRKHVEGTSRWKCRVFVDDSVGIQATRAIREGLGELDLTVEFVSVDESAEVWLRSRLRTVPSMQLVHDEHPVESWVAPFNLARIVSEIKSARARGFARVPVDRFVVTESAGCHRYSRWNEQLLSLPSDESGWSTVSYMCAKPAQLTVDLLRIGRICGLTLRGRASVGSSHYRLSVPPRVTLSLSRDGVSQWESVLDGASWVEGRGNESTWFFDAAVGRYARITFGPPAVRPDGKFFTQVSQIRFWQLSQPALPREDLSPAFVPLLSSRPTELQPVKHGLQASEFHRVEKWFLAPGQELPARRLPEAEALLVGLTGETVVTWSQPNDRAKLSAGDSLSVPSGKEYCVRAPQDGGLCAVLCVLTGRVDLEVWRSRQ